MGAFTILSEGQSAAVILQNAFGFGDHALSYFV